MSAITIIGVVLAGLAFALRLLEWLGVRPQTIREALSGIRARAVLALFILYELFLIVNTLLAPRPSDFLWWSMLVVFLWTVFMLLRVLVPKKLNQIVCNVASSSAVLYLTVVSWRLSRIGVFPWLSRLWLRFGLSHCSLKPDMQFAEKRHKSG